MISVNTRIKAVGANLKIFLHACKIFSINNENTFSALKGSDITGCRFLLMLNITLSFVEDFLSCKVPFVNI